MKKLFFTMCIIAAAISAANAQVQQEQAQQAQAQAQTQAQQTQETKITVPEPEFSQQSVYLTSDSTFIPLPRENATIKTKAAASLYLVGIGTARARLTIETPHSPVAVEISKAIRIVIKADNNKTDPNSFIKVFKFDVRGKRREAVMAQAGTFTGSESNALKTINYSAKKYGESSYLIEIQIPTTEDGEYGIMMSDPNTLTGKNALLITTFGVTFLS